MFPYGAMRPGAGLFIFVLRVTIDLNFKFVASTAAAAVPVASQVPSTCCLGHRSLHGVAVRYTW